MVYVSLVLEKQGKWKKKLKKRFYILNLKIWQLKKMKVVSFVTDYTNKGLQEEIPEPPSMVKRRKMLQFTADLNGDDADKNPITSSTVTSVVNICFTSVLIFVFYACIQAK